MKVISILQPWASLIIEGHKKIETRSWNTKYRGELLIHASKAWGKRQFMLNQEPFFKEFYDKLEPLTGGIYTGLPGIPLGAIIGKVNLVSTIETEELWSNQSIGDGCYNEWTIHEEFGGSKELAFGDYSPNRFGWLLSDPIIFEKPIPAKGKLGLWEYDWKG